MTSYKLLYTKTAAQDIRRLDVVTKKRLKKKLELFALDPLKYATRLSNSAIGTYRWRVGSYRVIFDIDKSNVVILRVGHRREIYKK